MPLPKAKGRPAGTEPVPTTPYGGLVDTEAPPAGRSGTGRTAGSVAGLVSLGAGLAAAHLVAGLWRDGVTRSSAWATGSSITCPAR